MFMPQLKTDLQLTLEQVAREKGLDYEKISKQTDIPFDHVKLVFEEDYLNRNYLKDSHQLTSYTFLELFEKVCGVLDLDPFDLLIAA